MIRGRGDVRYTARPRRVKHMSRLGTAEGGLAQRPGDGGAYQKRLPGTPLNGPATWDVIQPP